MKTTKHTMRVIKLQAWCECGGQFLIDEETRKREMEQLVYRSHWTYPHICNKCGKEERFDTIYPRIAYEEDSP